MHTPVCIKIIGLGANIALFSGYYKSADHTWNTNKFLGFLGSSWSVNGWRVV